MLSDCLCCELCNFIMDPRLVQEGNLVPNWLEMNVNMSMGCATVGLNKGRMSTLKSWEIGGENIQSKWVEVCCLPECHDAQAQSTLKILFFFGCAKKVLILLDGFSFLKLCPLPKNEMKWKSSRRSAFFTGGDPTPAAKALLLRDLRRDAVLNIV